MYFHAVKDICFVDWNKQQQPITNYFMKSTTSSRELITGSCILYNWGSWVYGVSGNQTSSLYGIGVYTPVWWYRLIHKVPWQPILTIHAPFEMLNTSSSNLPVRCDTMEMMEMATNWLPSCIFFFIYTLVSPR